MGKCLVTTLDYYINNMKLNKVGEVKFSIRPTIGNALLKICITNDKDGSKLYLPNKEGILNCDSPSFENAYEAELHSWAYYFNAALSKEVNFALNNKYSIKKLILECTEGNMESDINISELLYLNNLEQFTVNFNFDGEVKDFSNMPSLTSLNISTNNLHGTLKDFLLSPNLVSLYLTASQVKGDIDELAGHPNLKIIWITTPNVKGDASLLGKKVEKIYTDTTNSTISWKHERSSDSTIISMTAHMEEDVDAMLINQAKCVPGDNDKVLRIIGTRTSASDEAVATLQSKGYTVSITTA